MTHTDTSVVRRRLMVLCVSAWAVVACSPPEEGSGPVPQPSDTRTTTQSPASYSDLVAVASPVGHWSLDEVAGSDSIFGPPATPRGGVESDAPGPAGSGSSMRLDGVTGHVWIGEASGAAAQSLASTDEITVEVWMRPDALPDDGEPRHIARWRWFGWGIYVLDGRLYAEIWEGPSTGGGPSEPVGSTVQGPTLVVGRWYHVAVTKDDRTHRLLVDGVVVDESPSLGPIHYRAVDPAADCCGDGGGVAFGRDADVDGNYFSGSLDEVAIYPHSLDEATIATHAGFGDG